MLKLHRIAKCLPYSEGKVALNGFCSRYFARQQTTSSSLKSETSTPPGHEDVLATKLKSNYNAIIVGGGKYFCFHKLCLFTYYLYVARFKCADCGLNFYYLKIHNLKIKLIFISLLGLSDVDLI